jgi:L-fucose mutarotase/ribose pyranase (RbsD/FucU family)
MEYHGKLHGDTINLNDGLYPSVSSMQSREIHCHHPAPEKVAPINRGGPQG